MYWYTVAENLADSCRPYNCTKSSCHLKSKTCGWSAYHLNGNPSSDGAVAKVSGAKVRRHVGPAKVFDSEEDAIQAVLTDEIIDGDVVVVRSRWTYAGPGMPGDAVTFIRPIAGKGQRQGCPSDGWSFLWWYYGLVVGAIAPEACDGGPDCLPPYR